MPERRFEPLKNVPAYQNLSPRLGAAYDLFGTGRTALKASLGHYPDIIRTVTGNPAAALTRTTNRTWNDANRNFVPDCDLRNPGGQRRVRPVVGSDVRARGPAHASSRTACSRGSTGSTTTGRARCRCSTS